MNQAEVMQLLEKTGALIQKGHFLYTSGRHGKAYVNKDALYPHIGIASRIGQAFAEHFSASNVEVVVGPALGGIILSQWTAFHMSRIKGQEVLSVYAEKIEDGLALKRGYDKLVEGKRVLVVEDIVTTGMSVDKTIEATRGAGGNIVGVAVLCNRGGLTCADLKDVHELHSLVEIPLESWTAEECPLCKEGIPLSTQFGKGKKLK